MGIPGLGSFVAQQDGLLIDVRLRDCRLIIDGSNLYHFLYYNSAATHEYGGDYDVYAEAVRSYFDALRTCGVIAYVVLDGAYEPDNRKLKTTLRRAKERIFLAAACGRRGRGAVLPVMACEVFCQVLAELDVAHCICDFEADREIAELALQWNCAVLSNDSDFLVLPLTGGLVPLDSLEPKPVVGDVAAGNAGPYLAARLYNVDRLRQRYNDFDCALLPLIAAVLGSDYGDGRSFSTFLGDKVHKQRSRRDGKAARDGQLRPRALLQWIGQLPRGSSAADALASVASQQRHRGSGGKQLAALHAALSASASAYQLQASSSLADYFDTGRVVAAAAASGSPASAEDRAAPAVAAAAAAAGGAGAPRLACLPSWVREDLRGARIRPVCLNVLCSRRVILLSQVEDMAAPSAWGCSAELRRVMYSILLNQGYSDEDICGSSSCRLPGVVTKLLSTAADSGASAPAAPAGSHASTCESLSSRLCLPSQPDAMCTDPPVNSAAVAAAAAPAALPSAQLLQDAVPDRAAELDLPGKPAQDPSSSQAEAVAAAEAATVAAVDASKSKLVVTEYDREAKQLASKSVALLDRAGALQLQLPTLSELPGVSESCRSRLLVSALGLSPSPSEASSFTLPGLAADTLAACERLGLSVHVVSAALLCWLRRCSRPQASSVHLLTVLLGVLRIVGGGRAGRGPSSSSLADAGSCADAMAPRLADGALDRLKKLLWKQGARPPLHAGAAHAFAQLQACLLHAAHLAQLLRLPAAAAALGGAHRLFSGRFACAAFAELSRRPQPLLYCCELLARGSAPARLLADWYAALRGSHAAAGGHDLDLAVAAAAAAAAAAPVAGTEPRPQASKRRQQSRPSSAAEVDDASAGKIRQLSGSDDEQGGGSSSSSGEDATDGSDDDDDVNDASRMLAATILAGNRFGVLTQS